MNSLNANRNAPLVHGKEAQFLVEKITRERIFECVFWKEHCFSLDLYSLIEKTFHQCKWIGGITGNSKPVPFLCLLLKLLQLLPSKEIVLEVLRFPDSGNHQLKYVKCLFLFYHRLTASSTEVYRVLEPFMMQYCKIRIQMPDGTFRLGYFDEFIDDLLHQERVFGIILPRLPKRALLEANGELKPKEPIEMSPEEPNSSSQPTSQPIKQVKKLSFKKATSHEIDPADAIIQERQKAKQEAAEGISLRATNELRISLGLKPLPE